MPSASDIFKELQHANDYLIDINSKLGAVQASTDAVRAAVEQLGSTLSSSFGPGAMPFLHQIVQASDPMLASKAVWLAAFIDGQGSLQVLQVAISRPEVLVRIAAAGAIRSLGRVPVQELLRRLLEDDEPMIRKVALDSVKVLRPAQLRERIQELADDDPQDYVRELASEVLHALG